MIVEDNSLAHSTKSDTDTYSPPDVFLSDRELLKSTVEDLIGSDISDDQKSILS
uniref:Uncharacterized protein n=1 Tax=Anguilla anguilla TaxID=7936 RepID=A0A0E9TW50_ANGAN